MPSIGQSFRMAKTGKTDTTLVLHWMEEQRAWVELPWFEWVRFRGFGKERSSFLSGADPGIHYFLVCKLGPAGELCDVIPHRYIISNDARMIEGFDGLKPEERDEAYRLEDLPFPMSEEVDRLNELGARGFAANLPPLHTVQPLLRAIPGIAGARPNASCWNFLSAIGVCYTSSKPN
jgi:hypothetical protein